MPMPRFLSPFKRSGHGMRSDYDGSTRTSYYDNSQPQYSGPMSRSSPRNRSCWPKFFHKRGRDVSWPNQNHEFIDDENIFRESRGIPAMKILITHLLYQELCLLFEEVKSMMITPIAAMRTRLLTVPMWGETVICQIHPL